MSERAFLNAIAAALGAAPDHCKAGAKVVRFSLNGKRSDDSGWAVLFPDELGGVYGNWKTGFQVVWQSDARRRLTPAERDLQRQHIELAQARRHAEVTARHEAVAQRVAAVWAAAALAARHAYSTQKGFVPGPGLRVTRGHLLDASDAFYVSGDNGRPARLTGDLLLIPMFGSDRRLWSLQAIDEAGRKSFRKGGRTRGCFCVVGASVLRSTESEKFAGDIVVAEGIATASSVHDLSGSAAFAAFNAGNLIHVAHAVRARWPRARITIAGDVDPSGIGQRKAEEAAAAVVGFVSLPPLSAVELAAGASDWNDYVRLHPDGVRKARQA